MNGVEGPSRQLGFKDRIIGKVAATAVAISLAFGGSGGKANAETELSKKSLLTTESKVDQETENQSVVIEESKVEAEEKSEVEWLSIKDGIYYYKEGNPFGRKEGEVAGFIEKAWINGEQKEVAYLNADATRERLIKVLSETLEGEPNFTNVIPIDVSRYKGEVRINDSETTTPNGKTFPIIKIDCSEKIVVVNTNLDLTDFYQGYFKTSNSDEDNKTAYIFDSLELDRMKGGGFDESKSTGYRQIIFTEYDFQEITSYNCSFGEEILTIDEGGIILFCPNISFRQQVSSLLTIDEKIVFPIALEKGKQEVDLSQYETLKVGETGDEVKEMKLRLYELGYFKSDKLNADFSNETLKKVKEFEKANGLPGDGIADPEMLARLFSEEAIRKP